MVQSVELLLDPVTDERVRGEWQQLIDAGLPSQGLHTGSSNRPHITLAAATRLSADQDQHLAATVRGVLPIQLRVAGLLIFGTGPYVLSRAVVPTVQLLNLQQRAATALSGAQGRGDHQQPGGWTAHITLARRLDAGQLASALPALSPVAELPAQAVAVRRWDSDRKIDWLLT